MHDGAVTENGPTDREVGSDSLVALVSPETVSPIGTLHNSALGLDTVATSRLGFIIEDVEPSLSVDAPDDMVDLYGYTTMTVAALQAQARELAALRREVAGLKRDLARRRAR